jgi:hypothetical protein
MLFSDCALSLCSFLLVPHEEALLQPPQRAAMGNQDTCTQGPGKAPAVPSPRLIGAPRIVLAIRCAKRLQSQVRVEWSPPTGLDPGVCDEL